MDQEGSNHIEKNQKFNDEINKMIQGLYSPSSSKSSIETNFSDCASYQWKKSFDISITEKTIELEQKKSTYKALDNNDPYFKNFVPVEFEPSEITGRSTTCDSEAVSNKRDSLSIEQILASSFAFSDKRSFKESFYKDVSLPIENNTSKVSIQDSLISSSDSEFEKHNKSKNYIEEKFEPIENFKSKLYDDEKEWEKEYADIPGSFSKPRNDNLNKYKNSNILNNKKSLDYSKISIGSYFQTRSADLKSLIDFEKSPKKNKPVALINQSDIVSETNSSKQYLNNIEKYLEEINSKKNNTENNLNVLSISAISKALNDIDLNASSGTVLKRFLTLQPKNNYDCYDDGDHDSDDNKENIDKSKTTELSDTVSVTESFLESSNAYPFKIDLNKETYLPPTIKNIEKNVENKNNEQPLLRDKSRKRPYSAIVPLKCTENKDNLQNFRNPNAFSSPTKIKNSEISPANLTNETCLNNLVKDETKNISVKSSLKMNTLEESTKKHNNETNFESQPVTLNNKNNTFTDCQKFLLDFYSTPKNKKYSLPAYGLLYRSPSSSNLSSKSGSSEYSSKDGKLPLRVTCFSLSWGSVKLRKDVQKSMQIKNISNKKLPLRAEITGPGFQFVNSEQGNGILLHSQECRTITLSFCPTVIGPAIGKIKFFLLKEGSYDTMSIILYGYGGNASMYPQGISLGPIGSAFLTLGDLKQLSRPLTQTFSIYNKGPLTGFAILKLDSLGLPIPRLCESIEIKPDKVLILPQSSKTITVTFNPRRDDVKKIMKKINKVIVLANLRIIYGDEPTRCRIQNLYKNTKNEELNYNMNYMWEQFNNESSEEVDKFHEEKETILELFETLKQSDIALTLNYQAQSFNETIDSTFVYPEDDETILFRTIISNSEENCDDTIIADNNLNSEEASVEKN